MKAAGVALLQSFCRLPVAPGGYPRVLVMADGGALCHKCARGNYRVISEETRAGRGADWVVVACEIHWEGEPVDCDHCGACIESAYGVPGQE